MVCSTLDSSSTAKIWNPFFIVSRIKNFHKAGSMRSGAKGCKHAGSGGKVTAG
jgi:hypothetical protein